MIAPFPHFLGGWKYNLGLQIHYQEFNKMSSYVLENCKEAFDHAGIVIQPFVRESSRE
ncbi:hypothetical protein ACSVH2_03975 [Flavobacterium sp. RSB2_4_14]|uniref:hypothetical protein n=1 Tax=Flavobacterium sp. RSB2_4_14 TaxID=3447665 RepID=UPI003F32E505